MGRRSLFVGCALALLAGTLVGCGSQPLPPGGAAAVAYWHKVLLQHPDLPDKVRAIVDKQRSPEWAYDLPQSEVRIYGADEVVSVSGRRVDVVVTDLDDATLRQLLAWWEAVPRQAAELGLDSTLPFDLPQSTRHVVVLGREGRVAISGPGGYDVQSIHVLSDEFSGRTTIGVHAFGPEGQAAVEHLANQYKQVRGPPNSDVRAGRIALPPPEENVTVLVIGRLGQLDIAGPTDYAQQDITFRDYLNQHLSDDITGRLAGTPFAAAAAYVAENQEPYAEFADELAAEPAAESGGSLDSSPPIARTPTDSVPTITLPVTPVLPINNWQPPTINLPPDNFRPIQPPVVLPPPPVFNPPVVVPRFGS